MPRCSANPILISHLYLHIPFCHRICPYCSFYKHTPGATGMAEFVEAVLGELRLHQRHLELRPKTIHFGGGTPTLLSTAHLDALFSGMRDVVDLSDLRELCLEANPRTLGAAKARLLRSAGVTRVSLGVQSWDKKVLSTLGRDHSPQEAEEAWWELREAGIPSLNVDLMFSIPGLGSLTWEKSLEKTLSLRPDHISAYNLTYEEDTAFLEQLRRGELDADADRDADHFSTAVDRLEAEGFEHYEISNYAQPGHRSAHNSAYWHGADYLGIGPSAVSTVNRERWKNLPDSAAYVRAIAEGRVPVVESEQLDDQKWLMERVALELRTMEGTLLERIHPEIRPKLADLQSEGWVQVDQVAGRVRLTRQGMPLADTLAEQLLPDE